MAEHSNELPIAPKQPLFSFQGISFCDGTHKTLDNDLESVIVHSPKLDEEKN